MYQEELTPEDLDKFENLLERSGLIQRQKREALCYKIGIKPGDLEFIDRADDIFATLLTRRLNETRNKQALCLLFNKIEKELKGGDWRDNLDTIRGKLQCNASSSGSAPSFNPLPNQPDLRKRQSSFTKLLTKLAENIFNRFIVGLIMVVFAGIPLYWDKQKTQNPKRAFSPEVSTTPNKENTTKQQWKIENSNVYYIVFINNTNQQKNTLDAGGQGKKVYLHEKNGGDYQEWCVTPAN